MNAQALPQAPTLQQQAGAAAPHHAPASASSSGAVPVARRSRDTFNQQSLGPTLNAQVKQARVLLVGAGGIGCELLKNLVLAGFGEVHVVDLDTIDLSNLNRQFLFRHEHIKKSKALVAKEAAQRFNPKVEIVAHHGNIKESQFNVAWFRGFHLVFNALDNMEARRHVNKLCLAADVPLIESGTTGFNGQVQVIKKGVTACYDCLPKEAPKSFPVCTIRSTPSQPIHCIVWGKSYLLNEMFGTSEDESAFDHTDDSDNAQEIAELKKESEALKQIRQSIGTEEFPRLLFDKVFNQDIIRLRSMEDMWKSRNPPEPLAFETVMGQAAGALASKGEILADGQRVWSLIECFVVLNDSIDRLAKRMTEMKKVQDGSGIEPTIEFDKDDPDTLDFVAASANIRSSLFGIERKSRFDIKQMAGNIIPAIATTNAMVAGLCVLESFKVLRGEYSATREVFLSPFSLTGRLLGASASRKPNPECPVCSVHQTSVLVDLSRATLNDLVEDFVKLELGYGEKDFVVNNDVGILYDADETENLTRKLTDLGIQPDSFLTVIDEDDDDPFVNVVINIQESKDSAGEKPVKGIAVEEKAQIPRKPKLPVANGAAPHLNGKHALDSDGVAEVKKRARTDDASEPEAKKRKLAAADADDDLVIVDDARSGGAIVIDDD